MDYGLKKKVDIGGEAFQIRTDFRVILSIIEALNDIELDERERACVALDLFYPDFESIPEEYLQEAINHCLDFINCGMPNETSKSPKLIDWEMDYNLIISPINRILGYDARGVEYDYEANTGGVSWETFLSAYQEIGDCTFAQVVRIRDRLARGKSLDKADREWYRRNRALVDFKTKYTEADKDALKKYGGVSCGG